VNRAERWDYSQWNKSWSTCWWEVLALEFLIFIRLWIIYERAIFALTLSTMAPDIPFGVVMDLAVKEPHPIVGEMKSLIKRLSDPFWITSDIFSIVSSYGIEDNIQVEFLFAAAFAGVFCASTVPLISK
jgi:hypothetical protein